MNSTGCPRGFARDTFFVMGSLPEGDAPCIFSIPFYATFVSIVAIVLCGVAYLRTVFILKRARVGRNNHGKLNQIQQTTLAQSWATVIVTISALFVPLIYGTANNVMVLLFGFQNTLFWISAIRWTYKMVRLGGRIIDPSRRGGQDNDAASGDSKEDQLSKQDLLLKVSLATVNLIVIVQLIIVCILGLVFPRNQAWIRIGIGMTGFLTIALTLILFYQYHRCERAIHLANVRVKAHRIGEAGGPDTQVVVRKFNWQQFVLLSSGTPACVSFLLMSAEVVPLTYLVFILSMFCDALVNGSMFIIFIMKLSRKTRPQPSSAVSLTRPGTAPEHRGPEKAAELSPRSSPDS